MIKVLVQILKSIVMSKIIKKLKSPTSKKGNVLKVIGGLLIGGAAATNTTDVVEQSNIVLIIEAITALIGAIAMFVGQLKTKDD